MTALLIVACALTTVVFAAIQTFNGTGKYIMSEFETEDIARQRAIQKAKENAQDKAGVYLTSFSKTENARLTADEISAVTNNIINVSDVQVESEPFEVNGEPGIIWTVTLKATIDPDGIFDFIKRDDKDKVNIVQQNNDLRDAIQKNDEQVADLKEQYNRATSQAERGKIRQQMNQADRDFLANQKFEAALRLYYAKDYNGSIKLNTEAIELKPDWLWPYLRRGLAYAKLKQYEQAIQDYSTAIQLDPNNALMYHNRGVAYMDGLNQYERAIQDYNKAIQLNPNYANAYNNRGNTYVLLNQYERAIQDYNKAIQLNPNYADAYNNRGWAYYCMKQYERALQDFDKAIELNPNHTLAKNNRADCLKALGR